MALVVTIILLICGIGLLWRGQWPKRAGLTPHCRGCNYILTGLAADRCPECGQSLGPRNTVLGERRRRPAMAAVGIFLLLIALGLCVAPFTTAWQQIQWYHYRPTSWVFADLESAPTKTNAWGELQRRLGDGSLSVPQQDRLVERALHEQKPGGGAAGYMPEMVEFLGQRYLDHKLSTAQADAFFTNALKLQLEVRPQIGRDDPVPFRISAIGRGPQTGCHPATFDTSTSSFAAASAQPGRPSISKPPGRVKSSFPT
jgi:hypothetical protein